MEHGWGILIWEIIVEYQCFVKLFENSSQNWGFNYLYLILKALDLYDFLLFNWFFSLVFIAYRKRQNPWEVAILGSSTLSLEPLVQKSTLCNMVEFGSFICMIVVCGVDFEYVYLGFVAPLLGDILHYGYIDYPT